MRARSIPLALTGLACLLLATQTAVATEGEWKPSQIAEIHKQAKRAGLQLEAKQLWDPEGDERTGGLMRASVKYGGCSAAFVSPEGLIATNHHCAYGALQANSSVEHDYLKDGFLAATRGDELRAKGRSVKLLRSISDVTEDMEAALDGVDDDVARAKAYDRARNELVDACEAKAEFRSCRVAAFFNHTLYELHEYVELRDVRLVYAPPSAIGEYGGETDNWMWPRHTGDFSLLRAYAGPDGEPAEYAEDNVPYKPTQYLKPTADGVDPGDFVAILGYPGRTERFLWSHEVMRHFEQSLPMRVRAYGEWIEILEAAGSSDEAVKIKVAALQKSLANRHKNAAGKIAGLERLGFPGKREAEDNRLMMAEPKALEPIEKLAGISMKRRERAARQFLLDNLRYAPRSLEIARNLVTWAQQRAKPDVERKSGYRDRDRDRLVGRLVQQTKDYDAGVDEQLLASFLAHADNLEDGQRIAGFDAVLGAAEGEGGMPAVKRDGVTGSPQAYVDAAKAALTGTSIVDAETVEAMLADPAQIEASQDPMIVLARALVKDTDELAEIKDAERGKLLLLLPMYFEVIKPLRGPTVYSDANGTLRLSHATVQGYTKWNEQEQEPQTTLAGAVDKHQDAGDFDLPDSVLEAAKTATQSRWRDLELGDVPIAFLADGDTTGGNSGSPVIDAHGRLIGFNFDRTWENVAGDYVWREEQSRNIISDARYLYWMLDEVAGASHLIAELGLTDFQPKPKPEAAETEAASAPGDDAKQASDANAGAPAGGCACGVDEPDARSGWGLAFSLFAGLSLAARRRRSAP